MGHPPDPPLDEQESLNCSDSSGEESDTELDFDEGKKTKIVGYLLTLLQNKNSSQMSPNRCIVENKIFYTDTYYGSPCAVPLWHEGNKISLPEHSQYSVHGRGVEVCGGTRWQNVENVLLVMFRVRKRAFMCTLRTDLYSSYLSKEFLAKSIGNFLR